MADAPILPYQSKYVTINDRQLHYVEWGAADAASAASKPIMIMWHGLSRTGRDFDEVARYFSDTYRVLCPDTIGRGWSQWASDPEAEYSMKNYCDLAVGFVNATCGESAVVDWLGTSMGGIIGWHVCAADGGLKGRVRRLLLNDIGPILNMEAITAIAAYAGVPKYYDRLTDLISFNRNVYEATFGPQTEEWFIRVTEATARRCDDGRISQHFDMRCVAALNRPITISGDPWKEFDTITASEILAVRGSTSKLLLPEGHEAMASRGLNVRLRVAEGVGHAPAYTTPDQLLIADSFFRPERYPTSPSVAP